MQPKIGACSADNHVITISNLQNGETLCYSLVLIKGHIDTQVPGTCKLSKETAKISLRQFDLNNAEHITEWSVLDSQFKCIAVLHQGNNRFVLEYCGTTIDYSISYIPRNSQYCVTPLYIICDGHDGKFQAPPDEDNSIQSACQRISLGAKLVQCLMAEKLYELGLGRKSFQLDADIHPSEEPCKVFYSKLSVEKAYSMSSAELWEHFGRELMSSPLGASTRKFLAFLSCTRYTGTNLQGPPSHDDVLMNTQAHVALGGGGLAIFGSACLHTWPSSVEEIVPRFLDTTRIDQQKLMDDSCFRGTYGGCFATTLGATCHELGHTFDLGHTQEGLMSRGFDNVDLVFTLSSAQDKNKNLMTCGSKTEPQHSTVCFTVDLNVTYTMSSPITRRRNRSGRSSSGDSRDEPRTASPKANGRKLDTTNGRSSPSTMKNENARKFVITRSNENDLTFWSNSCGVILYYHRWFNNPRTTQQSYQGAVKYDDNRHVVASTSGVRVIELREQGGMVLKSWEFIEGSGLKEFVFPKDQIRELVACNILTVVAEDSDGNMLKREVNPNIIVKL